MERTGVHRPVPAVAKHSLGRSEEWVVQRRGFGKTEPKKCAISTEALVYEREPENWSMETGAPKGMARTAAGLPVDGMGCEGRSRIP